MRKVLDAIAVLSLILSGSLVAASVGGYLYIKNPVNQDKLKDHLLKEVTGAVPGLVKGSLPETLPKTTGPALPFGGS